MKKILLTFLLIVITMPCINAAFLPQAEDWSLLPPHEQAERRAELQRYFMPQPPVNPGPPQQPPVAPAPDEDENDN